MENKERQILSEIMDMMASLRSQAELNQSVNQEDEDLAPIDLDLDDFSDDLPEAELEVVVPEPEVIEAEPETVEADEEVIEAEPEVVEVEPEVEVTEPEEVDDDLPFFTEPEPILEPEPLPVHEPEPVAEPILEQKPMPAVIDSMTDRQAWRTDMPGTPVKDIRSAISLNDRILFINMLFGQDPMTFQDALTKINQLGTLDEAVQYIVAEHPEWDLESETVYRFMMAVRRKIR